MGRRLAAGTLALMLLGSVAFGEPQEAKQCVGDPPRQTEDPLSPACVPTFDGDNGGSTSRGVSGEEVRIVLYNDFGLEGELNTPYDPSDEPGDQTHWVYRNLNRTAKAQLRYFLRRFQTYARTVRVVAYPSGGGLATEGEQRKGEALDILNRFDPFAIVTLIENAQEFAAFVAERKVMTFGANFNVPRAVYRDGSPYVWSLMPDQETQTAWSSSFICDKLQGRPARFTSDPTLKGKQRSFALITPEYSQRGPQFSQMAALLTKGVQDRCGMDFEVSRTYNGSQSLATVMTDLKTKGITTVACYCIPQQTELHAPIAQSAATAIGYFPEWYWDHAAKMDRTFWAQQFANPLHSHFGPTYLWRHPEPAGQHHDAAYRSEEPDEPANLRFNFELYLGFLQLFTAIQNAGPTLTPGNVRDGLTSFAVRNLADPFVPTGGYDDAAPSRRTFIDSATAWWWDPIGTPPEGRAAEGCVRLANGGARVYADGWQPGDGDLFTGNAPCSGAPWGMYDL